MTVKAAIVFKRKPGIELEAFRSYWLNEHPKAVLKMPGLVRYCQNHPLPFGYRKGELACDGVAETWWEDMETLRRNAALPEFQALCEDEARFIDRAGMATLLVEEHVIVDGERPADGVKNIELIHRKPGMAVGAFQGLLAPRARPRRRRDRADSPLCAEPCPSRRLPRRQAAGAGRPRRHLVRRHRRHARLRRLGSLRGHPRRRSQFPRRVPPRLRRDEGASHQGVTGPPGEPSVRSSVRKPSGT